MRNCADLRSYPEWAIYDRETRWRASATALVRMFSALILLTVLTPSTFGASSVPPKAATSPRPNIILVTLDTTRADRMGFLGCDRGLTPNLDAIARQAAVFTRAYAQVPLTTPSHAAILSGTYPQFNGVNYLGDALPQSLPYLPEIFHKNGYRTAAFVGSLVLDPKKLAPGFDRGFDVYNAGFHRRSPDEDRYRSVERRGEEVVSRALAWLSKQTAGPVFLWVHLYDPHDPYTPPEPYKTRFEKNPYDGEIAYTDAVVGKLFAGLRVRGRFDNSLIAVMADHGEAFGEHGENHHGIFLYDETIQVPLVFKLPGKHSALRVDTRVGMVDVAPTILQVAHLPIPAAVQGESLLSAITADPSKPSNSPALSTSVYSESGYGHLSFGWSKLQAWRTGNYLYVEAPEKELYDQSRDPVAAHNVASDSRAVAETASAQVKNFYQKTKGAPAEKTQLSAEQSESLHALGYMTSESGKPGASEDESGPDPKERIGVANLLYEAMAATESEQFAEAIPLLEQVLQQEPKTPTAALQLGRAYMALKQYQKAVAPLQSVVEAKPDNSFAHYELGCALVKTGHWEEAAPQFEAAVSQMSSSTMMHFYLALVYQRTSRIPEAAQEFQTAVRLDPKNFAANLLLGRLLAAQKNATQALPYLRKAAALHPDSSDAHRFLSDVYGQLGRDAEAKRELAEAERILAQGGSRLGSEPGASPPKRR